MNISDLITFALYHVNRSIYVIGAQNIKPPALCPKWIKAKESGKRHRVKSITGLASQTINTGLILSKQ